MEIIAERDCQQQEHTERTSYALALLQTKLGDQAFNWLWQCPVVFNDLRAYFVDPGASEIRNVVTQYFGREENTVYQYLLPSFASDAATVTSRGLTDDEETKKVSNDGRQISLGHRYIVWLNTMIKTKEMTVNEVHSYVHLLENGDLFLIKDRALVDFMKLEAMEENPILRSLEKKGFLKTNQARGFFKATIDGQSVEGNIILDAKGPLTALADYPQSSFITMNG